MKKLSFSMLAMAGLLLVGCADKDVIGEGGGIGSQGEAEGDGYMALNINLPTTPISRAVNDNFDDGTPNEYRVNDCALLLFAGSSEETAKFINAQEIELPFVDTDDDNTDADNVTTTYKAVAKVSEYNESDGSLYALVFLNYKNVIAIDDQGNVSKRTGGETAPTAPIKEGDDDITFADFQNATIGDGVDLKSRENLANRYFFMANAVLATKPGGNTNPTTEGRIFQLAKLDGKIYNTREEAIKNPSGDVFVERALAKATLTYKKEAADNMAKEGDLSISITSVQWLIDNIEPNTFIVRNPGENVNGKNYPLYLGYSSDCFNLDNKSNYRFVGSASVNTSASFNSPDAGVDTDHEHGKAGVAYRTYWCIDPQYNKIAKDMKHPAESEFINADGAPLYCHENTFNVENQTYQNTTRAILKVGIKATKQVNGTSVDVTNTLHTVNKDGKLYDKDGVETLMIGKVLVNMNFLKAISKNLKDEEKEVTEEKNGYTMDVEKFKTFFTIVTEEIKENNKTRTVFANINIKYNEFKKTTSPFIFEATATDEQIKAAFNFNEIISDIKTLVDDNVVAYKYDQGVMYYEARFTHFAGTSNQDSSPYMDLAPWNNWENEYTQVTNPSSAKAYPVYTTTNAANSAEMNYLGRYGMVRNNWYDVEVTEFKKPGMPVVPTHTFTDDDPGDTTDDNLSDYISVRVHVLSWAKRMQSWGF